MSEPIATAAPEQPQLKPEDKRRALFAAAGERIYLMEKMQLELNAIRAELDKDRPSYPPQTPAPTLEPEPKKETPPTNG